MERQRPGQDLRADELVERVVASDVLADRDQLATRAEQAGRVQAAGLVEGALGGAQQVRAARARPSAATTGPGGSGSTRSATSSIEALPQIPHDAVATKWRSATFESSNGRDSRTTIVSSGWLSARGSPPLVPEHLLAVEQTLGPEEPDRELGLVAGRAHRDRDRDRVLARPGRPDLERRLADDAIVADLERVAADRHDPMARHVPDGRHAIAAQARHVVASRARPKAVEGIARGLRRVDRVAECDQPGQPARRCRPT